MTTQEFFNEFDILYNSITSNQAPGLDTYEKSVLLTQAQEELVVEAYRGTFEGSEESRRALCSLVTYTSLSPKTNKPEATTEKPALEPVKEVSQLGGPIFSLPAEVWFITYEAITIDSTDKCLKEALLDVVPVTQDEYNRIRKNPFRGPTERHALRLDLKNGEVTIISKHPIKTYNIGYIKKPAPIILGNIAPLTINGMSTESNCELNTVTHRDILKRAVEIAQSIYLKGGTQKQ